MRNAIVIVVAILVLVIAARACGVGEGGAGGGGSNQASQRTFTSEDYAELATDPDSFRGASVDIVGRVFRNPEVRGSQASFQMFADPENSEWNTIVHTEAAPSGLQSDDYVRVQGTVRGAREGENAFGGTVRAVEVQADSVEITQSSADRKSKRRGKA